MTVDSDTSSDEITIKQIHALGSRHFQPNQVDVLVNQLLLRMELDTGAAVSSYPSKSW